MLYLLFVLTFLAGILFYGLSPSDKNLQEYTHQSEGMIVAFLAQHQAAKDYLYTWLGASDANNVGNLQNTTKFLKVENNPDRANSNLEEMMPQSIISSMCTENNGTPGREEKNNCFVSKVVDVGTGADAKHYVITYGGWSHCSSDFSNCDRPSWWPEAGQRMRRFESWRKAVANRTRGSTSCGVLFLKGGGKSSCPPTKEWCIDNGETALLSDGSCMTKIPPEVIADLPYNTSCTVAGGECVCPGADDLLFCMTEFKETLNSYASGVNYFYDGLSNHDFGERVIDHGANPDLNGSAAGINLANTATTKLTFKNNTNTNLTGGNGICVDGPCYALTQSGYRIDTPISLSGQFTITVLAKIKDEYVYFGDDSDGVAENRNKLFRSVTNGNKGFEFFFGNGVAAGPPNQGFLFESYNNKNNLISWTITYNGSKVKLYENTKLRQTGNIPTLSGHFSIWVATEMGADIYGIRAYSRALSAEEIQQNFKVDQKRFGIPDICNGGKGNYCTDKCDNKNASDCPCRSIGNETVKEECARRNRTPETSKEGQLSGD